MRSTMQDAPLTIARMVRYAVGVHSGSEVVTWTQTGPSRSTYGELGERAARLANVLRSLGVTGDQRVGSFAWNNREHLTVYAAVPSMGAVLHTLNIRLFPEQLAYTVNHAADQVLIVDGSLVTVLAPVLKQMSTVRHVLVTGGGDRSVLEGQGPAVHDYEAALAAASAEFDFDDALIGDERDAAALCYTSGTTGNPKGVAYSHRSIWLHSMQVCTNEAFGLSQADRVLSVVPMFHAMAWGLPYAAMMCGASQLLPDRFLTAEPLAEFIATERPTVAGAVPTIWGALLAHLDAHPRDVSSLRDVVVGGSACPPAMMAGFEERHGVRLVHAWGMTELSPLGSVSRPPAGCSPELAWERRLSQGRLPCAVEGRLVDDTGTPIPNDGHRVGELEVRGPWVAASYFVNPELPEPAETSGDGSTEKFHDGWLRTGDVGSLTPDGFLTLSDRAKDVIKSGGEWISSVDMENLIMGHPDVKEAAVIGVPDPKWDERPLAAVVLRPDASATLAQLRTYLSERVARWQLPEHWVFVAEIPKTSVGKFDKKALRASHRDGALDVTTFG
jgi:fatty-acyl-CoA synthase